MTDNKSVATQQDLLDVLEITIRLTSALLALEVPKSAEFWTALDDVNTVQQRILQRIADRSK